MSAIEKKVLVPHLWFRNQAVEAAELYCSLFPESRITSKSVIRDTPLGDCDYLSFILWGQRFEAISAGPYFSFNPSISFMVNFDPLFFKDAEDPELAARGKLDEVWEILSDGGTALMELGEYGFSSRFGWIQDKYGLSWQLILTDPEGMPRPSIIPSLLFVGAQWGRAEEAGAFYLSVFRNSEQGTIERYPAGMEPEKEGTVMFSDFKLGDSWLIAMDSAQSHDFQFNEAISFIVTCKNQAEIDYYWQKLSAVPDAEQCGWLKDKYGVSWQIVPEDLNVFLSNGSEKQQAAVTQVSLKMKKFNIDALHRAYEEAR